ncbi:MAG TPA: phosphomannomutase, partial [Rheinheimera sp.]|nr:phosphomannomutase [Rheinheimera sp.]
MSLKLSDIISHSNVQFGTSGARGLVSDFTAQVCAAFTQSFLHVLLQRQTVFELALAIDNRPSSDEIASACAGAAKAMGVKVHYYGVLPTPALAYFAIQHNMPAIMVTGSHIPFDRNGLKFYRPDGEINKADEHAILNCTAPLIQTVPFLPEVDNSAANLYVKRYTDFYPHQLLSGKHIGIYQHSSSGRDLYPTIFQMLGAKVSCIGRTDTFVAIDTEAVSQEDKARAQEWSEQFGFDAIFSTDGDGDRPLLADEKGNWLRGDIVGLLCAKALGIAALAVPVNCNTAIELIGEFNHIRRTQIGSPYVLATLQQFADDNVEPFAGFEANGGFLLGSNIHIANRCLKALPTRDAVLPVLAILALAADNPLSVLSANLPQRYTASDRLQQVAINKSQMLLAKAKQQPDLLLKQLGFANKKVSSVNLTDGVRLICDDGDILHLRPSGNAPELRC